MSYKKKHDKYARSNRLLYFDHELSENVVTRGTLYDILRSRHARGDDTAAAYVTRLAPHYPHRLKT